jgi:hypothetical protein
VLKFNQRAQNAVCYLFTSIIAFFSHCQGYVLTRYIPQQQLLYCHLFTQLLPSPSFAMKRNDSFVIVAYIFFCKKLKSRSTLNHPCAMTIYYLPVFIKAWRYYRFVFISLNVINGAQKT